MPTEKVTCVIEYAERGRTWKLFGSLSAGTSEVDVLDAVKRCRIRYPGAEVRLVTTLERRWS